MANEEHLAKLNEGVEAWNSWRKQNRRIQPDLSGANLERKDLNGAYLKRVNFSGANLKRAKLRELNLRGADFDGAELRGADLSYSDLTHAQNIELDSNHIFRTRFSPRAKDKWSVLRRTYTGPNMVVNLIFVLLFFAPLVIKGGGLAILSDAQHRVIESVNQIEGYKLSVTCNEPQGAVAGTVGSIEVRVPCRAEPMWKLLLGFGGPSGILMPLLTVILILYQITRYLQTWQISLMRDAEERSGVSPPKDGRLAYPHLYRIHQILSAVFWISMLPFAIRAYEFLFLSDVIFMGSGH